MIDMPRLNISRLAALALPLSAALPATALDEFKLRDDMYDFDQRRDDLPNNGSMYCVPTSQTNMFRYLKRYGMTAMMGGYGDSYSDITGFLLVMGILMGTSPSGGTGFTAACDVSTAWINSHTNKLWFGGRYGPSSDWSYRTIMNQFRAGALVRLGRGKYIPAGSGEWDRDGGHAVSMAGHNRVDSGAGTNYLFVCDPADDDNLNSQSPFSIVAKETVNITLDTVDHGIVTHARYTMNSGSNNNRRYMVDSMYHVLPVFAGWTLPTSDATTIRIKFPFQMNPPTHAEYPTEYAVNITENLRDWCIDPSDFSLYYLTTTGVVRHFDHATQTTTQVFNSAAARKLAIGGPNQDLFVLRVGTNNDAVTRVARRDGSLLTRTMNGHAAGIDVDDTTGGVVALAADLNSATVWGPEFGTPQVQRFRRLSSTTGTPMFSVGEPLFSIDAASGDYFVAVDGNSFIERFQKVNNLRIGQVVRPRISGISDLTAGPNNLLFVRTDSNVMWTLDHAGNYVSTDFSGYAVGALCRVPRNFTMHKAGEMTGSKWVDSPPVGDEP